MNQEGVKKDWWERKSPKEKTKFVLGLILLVLIVVFAIANWVTISFSIIFTSFKVPLTLVILGAMIFGYIVSSFMESNYYRKKKEEVRNNEKRALEKQDIPLEIKNEEVE